MIDYQTEKKLTTPSFRCSKADTARTNAICRVSELRELDALLGVVFYYYRDKRGRNHSISKRYLKEQRTWIKQASTRCSYSDNTQLEKCVGHDISARIKYMIRNYN